MDKYILVDAGTTQDRAFIENLKMSGKLEKIGLIILTHGHYDHVGYASILQEKFKIPIAMHFGDIEKVSHASMDFPPAKGFLSGTIRRLTMRNIQNATYHKFKPDIILDSQSKIVGFPDIKILHLPGHTQGSIGIEFDGNLLAGDLVMNILFPSTTWFAENFYLVQDSIRSICDTSFLRIYPGHGSPFSGRLLKKLL